MGPHTADNAASRNKGRARVCETSVAGAGEFAACVRYRRERAGAAAATKYLMPRMCSPRAFAHTKPAAYSRAKLLLLLPRDESRQFARARPLTYLSRASAMSADCNFNASAVALAHTVSRCYLGSQLVHSRLLLGVWRGAHFIPPQSPGTDNERESADSQIVLVVNLARFGARQNYFSVAKEPETRNLT